MSANNGHHEGGVKMHKQAFRKERDTEGREVMAITGWPIWVFFGSLLAIGFAIGRMGR